MPRARFPTARKLASDRERARRFNRYLWKATLCATEADYSRTPSEAREYVRKAREWVRLAEGLKHSKDWHDRLPKVRNLVARSASRASNR
jgi:hypothetical protein